MSTPMLLRALALLGASLCLAPAAQADTLVENVNGITLDEGGEVKTFAALLFDADGKIKALYERKDKRPRADYQVDGKGRTMIPGLIDAHAHVMALGLATLTLDLSDTRSLAEALEKVSAYAAAHPDRPWIIGRGWNQEVWGLGRFPTATDLDAVVADRPVWLERADGHAGWANSAAMTAAGIAATVKDPAGGRIERGPGNRPAGVFVDNAVDLVQQFVPVPRPADLDVALDRAQNLLFRNGVTAVADMGTTLSDWQAYRRAGDLGHLKLRIMAYAGGIETMVTLAGSEPTPWLYDDRLRLNGVKLWLDGALGSRGAWLRAPYADDPGNRGLPLMNDTQLRNLMSRAAMDGFQVAVHAIGDQANTSALDAVEELQSTYKGDRRFRIEHAQIVDPADLPKFGALGVIASMQPAHQTSDRTMAEARLGPGRLAGAYAWQSIATGGSTLAFGSDAPVETPDPFAGIAIAMTREDADRQPFGGWQPQERVDRIAALAGYTTGAAFAGFAEARIGRLAPGMRADFLLIDRDILLATPANIRATRVLETWIGGEKVFESSSEPGAIIGR